MAAPVPEQAVDEPEFRAAFVVAAQRCLRARVGEGIEEPPACAVVDRPAVVRIDQGELPHLGALVEVGMPGQGSSSVGCASEVPRPRSTSRWWARNASRSATKPWSARIAAPKAARALS